MLVDFGLRRSHGAEAGLAAARASYVAGFAGTATVLAEQLWGVPTFGTMAHSFIEAFDDETAAFEKFARSRPENLTLLIDTYDTEAAARKLVGLAPRLKVAGITIHAVRLDSGDLTALSKSIRRILDVGGLANVAIFASGGAYKLAENAGLPRRKRSTGKASWPGRKQVWRRYGPDGRMSGDVVSTEADSQSGEQLLHLVMQDGRRVAAGATLAKSRARAARDLGRLPEPLRLLEPGMPHPIEVAGALADLAAEVDRRLAQEVREQS